MQETVDSPQPAAPPVAQSERRAGTETIIRPSLAKRTRRALAPLPWLAPALALIAFVVLWPVWEMFTTSRQHINSYGFNLGAYGWKNYSTLFADPNLGSVMARTVLWTFAIVAITVLISLALAQLLNRGFPGRRVVRWALIAPWAASVMMTAIVFRWMLDPNNGVVNVFLHQIGVVKDTTAPRPPGWATRRRRSGG
jgi:multiple sugar transport system permease protein